MRRHCFRRSPLGTRIWQVFATALPLATVSGRIGRCGSCPLTASSDGDDCGESVGSASLVRLARGLLVRESTARWTSRYHGHCTRRDLSVVSEFLKVVSANSVICPYPPSTPRKETQMFNV